MTEPARQDGVRGARILIVAAPFYRQIADLLIEGAREALKNAGAEVDVIEVPGALEIPPAIRLAENAYDGFVALGAVIRGETTHYETVCNDSSRGLMLLGIERGLAIGNGILTCEDMDQTLVRADPGQKNKGAGAAEACLALLALKRRFAPIPSGGGKYFAPESEHIKMAGDAGTGKLA